MDAGGRSGHARGVTAADGADLEPARGLAWALSVGVLVCGWGSLPLLLVSSTSFVLSALLIVVALSAAGLVALECRASRQTAVALLGAAGALVAPVLFVLGMLLQE